MVITCICGGKMSVPDNINRAFKRRRCGILQEYAETTTSKDSFNPVKLITIGVKPLDLSMGEFHW
jgi:hypothetical protein